MVSFRKLLCATLYVAHPDAGPLIFMTDMLLELARREKIAGVKPDEDLDIFMKVNLFML